MEAVQRSAAGRVVGNYSRNICVTALLRSLSLQPLCERRREHRLHLLFSIANGLTIIDPEPILAAPHYFSRSDHHRKIKAIRSARNYGRYSFFPRTIRDWNSLTADNVDMLTLDIFKNRLIRDRAIYNCPNNDT